MLSESLVPSSPPRFTTPSLDFNSHSEELKRLIASLYRFRDVYWTTRPFIPANSDVAAQLEFIYAASTEAIHSADTQRRALLLENVEKAIDRFNLLTKPPSKRKKEKGDKYTNKTLLSQLHADLDAIQIESTHAFDPTLSDSQQAFYLYLRGKLYNILPVYHLLAEQNLQRAVHLDPKFIDAWIALAECLWKKGDHKAARLCYDKCLKIVWTCSIDFNLLTRLLETKRSGAKWSIHVAAFLRLRYINLYL